MKRIVIAIDGYSSSGKSSMAKQLARTIGYRYVDTGAMYRAVTLYALDHGMFDALGNPDSDAIVAAMPQVEISFELHSDGTQHTILNGKDVEREIRSMRVADKVSPVAAIPGVRHALVAMQQSYGVEKGIVMDGRDIGTTVFPDAELKIFVDASPQTRAQRRLKELIEKGMTANYEEVLANVVKRDEIDRTRAESPLRKADDAILLDNSHMSIDEQNKLLLDWYHKAVDKE